MVLICLLIMQSFPDGSLAGIGMRIALVLLRAADLLACLYGRRLTVGLRLRTFLSI